MTHMEYKQFRDMQYLDILEINELVKDYTEEFDQVVMERAEQVPTEHLEAYLKECLEVYKNSPLIKQVNELAAWTKEVNQWIKSEVQRIQALNEQN